MNTHLLLIMSIGLGSVACTSPQEVAETEVYYLSGIQDITDEEAKALVLMREEEKLAHDVYGFLYEKWGNRIFDNIGQSEQRHMEAVLDLLGKYELEDPIAGLATGEFATQQFQDLYNDLTTKGAVSLVEALKVGALIEELDIVDLQEELDETVVQDDIQTVFENLQRGSRNHLRAFVRNLDNNDIDYSPVYLSQEAFNAIIESDNERGGGGGSRRH